ncbi:Transcription factor [Coemansia thaxteri]|uniref:Transcription factor n=1 Tax=Coemansia thaxteri TaxID=2663907 RepID=A0A9W8BIH0_9FUNG|nr:Transcription factor [Coemansia thaxteri]KAJ2009702.1 Transcription factor [Coemansia thaxteri]KAJ2485576.1 Transcription factor [Coemansia sp. RSA 2320]
MATHKSTARDLAFEPNPFEHSFARLHSDDSVKASPASSASGDGKHSHRVTLPPVTAINGPVDPAHLSPASWGAESLRSGPLSPAMLGGPIPASSSSISPSLSSHTVAATKPANRMTGPLVMPSTGLTPYISGEAQPCASHALRVPAELATPGTQAMVLATLKGQAVSFTPGGTMHASGTPHELRSTRIRLDKGPSTYAAGSLASHSAALVSSAPPGVSRSPMRGYSQSPSPMPPPNAKRARPAQQQQRHEEEELSISMPPPKRSNFSIGNSSSRGEDSDNSDDEEQIMTHTADGRLLTESEKRKQFLERNRIAALKCRQRKKKQLQELQERHDFMVSENERLRADYMKLREIALQARAMLAAHANCPVARSAGVYGVDSLPPGMPAPSLQSMHPPDSSEDHHSIRALLDAISPVAHATPAHAVGPDNSRRPIAAMRARPRRR